MPGPAAIVAGIGLVLAVVDVGFSVHDALVPDPLQDDVDKLNDKLDELSTKVDDLEGALSDLGTALLDEFNVTRQLIVDLAISDATILARGARDKLFEYRAQSNPTEAQRQAIIEDAEDALRAVVGKAQAALSEPGAVAGFMGQMASVLATRIAVAAELEGGAIGKQSIRTALEDVSVMLRTAHSELYDVFESAVTYTNLAPDYVDGIPLPSSNTPFEVRISVRGESPYAGLATTTTGVTFDGYLDWVLNWRGKFNSAWASARETLKGFMVDFPFGFEYGLDQLTVIAGRLEQLSDGIDAFAPTNASAVVEGTDGNDLLRGKGGDDTLMGFGDHDVIRGEGGDDDMFGGDGNDLLEGGAGNDLAVGGEGDDGLVGGRGRDTLNGGDGNDQLSGGEDEDWLQGDAGDDVVDGGARADRAYGGAGNDMLRGGTGRDSLFGGNGDDYLSGDGDGDLLAGGFGNDTLLGGVGADTLRGDGGRDNLFGGANGDLLLGGRGGDRLLGDDGNDLISGDAGADWASGGLGHDTLRGGLNNDALFGGWGDDALSGGANNDRLSGGTGADTLSGGNGFDLLTGGGGADVFVFGSDFGRGQDRITDFVSGTDMIHLDSAVFMGLGLGALDPADVQASATATGSGPTLLYHGGVLSYDADGAGGMEAVGIVRLVGGAAVEASDIVLI